MMLGAHYGPNFTGDGGTRRLVGWLLPLAVACYIYLAFGDRIMSSPHALLVVGDLPLGTDQLIASRVENAGLIVDAVLDWNVTLEMCERSSMLLISASAVAASISVHLKNCTAPAIVWEEGVWRAMGMVGGASMSGAGVASDYWAEHPPRHARNVLPNPPPHIIFPGEKLEEILYFSRSAWAMLQRDAQPPSNASEPGVESEVEVEVGTMAVPLYTRSWPMTWATSLGSGARSFAHLDGDEEKSAFFTYDQGAQLVAPHGPSPALRIGLPLAHFAHGERPTCDEPRGRLPGCVRTPPNDEALPLAPAGLVLIDLALQLASGPAFVRHADLINWIPWIDLRMYRRETR